MAAFLVSAMSPLFQWFGAPLVAGAFGSPCFLFNSFSTSRSNCFMHVSATSALEPLYLAPLLSCVLVQITPPSGLTKRTATLASLMVSLFTEESLLPMWQATKPPTDVHSTAIASA